MQTWRQGLSDWKDFNKDFGNIYPNGLNQDTESALYARASVSNNTSSANNNTNNSKYSTAKNTNNNAVDLSQVVVDQDEDDDTGVRPLMKVFSFSILSKKNLYFILYIMRVLMGTNVFVVDFFFLNNANRAKQVAVLSLAVGCLDSARRKLQWKTHQVCNVLSG